MNYTDIIHNPHFNNLAAIFNVVFWTIKSHDPLYKRLKSEIPFWSLWQKFDRVTPIDVPLNKEATIDAFTELLLTVTQAAPELLWYTEDDLNWFFGMLDSENGLVTISLFKAWVSAKHTYLTPIQVSEITGAAESTMRNRAAGRPGAKAIPGCKKPGKDWLIPLAVLQAQGEIDWSYRPERESE